MLNVTINMTMKDFETMKDLLNKAYLNTCTEKFMEIDRENIEWANAQIVQVLNMLETH